MKASGKEHRCSGAWTRACGGGLGGKVAVVISKGDNERLLVGAMSKNEFKQLQSNFNNVCYVGSNRWRNAPCDSWTVAPCACQIKDTSFWSKPKLRVFSSSAHSAPRDTRANGEGIGYRPLRRTEGGTPCPGRLGQGFIHMVIREDRHARDRCGWTSRRGSSRGAHEGPRRRLTPVPVVVGRGNFALQE